MVKEQVLNGNRRIDNMKKEEKRRIRGNKISVIFMFVMAIWMLFLSVKEMLQYGIKGEHIKGEFGLIGIAIILFINAMYYRNQVKREDEKEKKKQEPFSEYKQRTAHSKEKARQMQYGKRCETIEKEIYWNSVTFSTGILIILLILFGVPGIIIFIIEKGFVLSTFWCWTFVLGIVVIALEVYSLLGFPKYKFQKMVHEKGYSMDEINRDFQKGKAFVDGFSYVLVGQDYSIYLCLTNTQVIRNKDILRAYISQEKINIYQNSVMYAGQMKKLNVNVNGRKGSLKISCNDEGVAQAIVEAFESVCAIGDYND